MPSTVELIKLDLIQQLDHIVGQRVAPEEYARTFSEFVRGFYRDVAPGELISQRPDHLYAAAVSMYAFANKRMPGEPKVRVYDPDPEEHGWKSHHTVVEVINDDMPFLVDSVRAELIRQGGEIQQTIHPIFDVERASDFGLLSARRIGPKPAQRAESFMHFRVRLQPEHSRHEIQTGIDAVLADVRAAVDDFREMRRLCGQVSKCIAQSKQLHPDEEREEIVEFLSWLCEDDFAFLGYRYSKIVDEAPPSDRLASKPGLGILRDPARLVFEGIERPKIPRSLRIFKANRRSTVHRPVHKDVVAVSDYDERGVVVGEHMFVGLFTLSAYSRSPQHIPLLRHKIRRVLEQSGFAPRSHDAKALKYVLETYPRDELFQISESTLLEIAIGVLHLEARPRVALFARRDPFGRFVSCLVYLPRDLLDTSLRIKVQRILAQAYDGTITAYYTSLSDVPLARLHMIVKTPKGASGSVDEAVVERRLFEATRSWTDRLETVLVNEQGEDRGVLLARAYRNAFGASYRELYDEIVGVTDIEFVDEALASGELTMQLYRPPEAKRYEFRLKLFVAQGNVLLSDILPMLENMGLRVVGETPHEIRPLLPDREQVAPAMWTGASPSLVPAPGALLPSLLNDSNDAAVASVWMHDFELLTKERVDVELSEATPRFIAALKEVWCGRMDNDGFNQLVLVAGLNARQVQVIRAYAHYLQQCALPFSLAYMQRTLVQNAPIAAILVKLFEARFDPERASHANAHELVARVQAQLEQVRSLDQDRILRAFNNLILATTRTNHYQSNDDGTAKEYLSLKLDSANLDELPRPRPEREIFVFGSRVAGVHLRFGAVARGGIRWSDRLEDFRTEVLGLVKAQQVKNAVIVPVGSKGGFVVRKPPPIELGRDALRDEGVRCYQMFISGLLDLTDNLAGEEVVTPKNLQPHDGNDPYLVVAADKGTATFSDIANKLSRSYGFWLDDAFASGGSAGYDHKKMGITARGAWEAIQRQFRELGKDIQSESFSCVGIGDMSGDVFGNGMLLSEHTKLVAAFNHLHIFVDPNPEPSVAWRERKRLFELPRSTWKDYEPSLISRGGGVFERAAKSIELSAEAKTRFGLQAASVTPDELIRALLKSEVELLFFGGIGTYVKAKSEVNADVGDRFNDGLRVDATELRARVIGEGANLAVTHRARIEYAGAGGRCNSDFIDNSAGVDCSDHEVNIKVLLSDVERATGLSREQRNELLEQMTDNVAELVLRDTYLQTQSLTVTESLGGYLADRTARYMRALEKAGKLDRELEFLPDDETLQDRRKFGAGFVRPELCVLLSYAKNDLYAQLVASDAVLDPYLARDLAAYFPQAVRQRYPQQIARHRLRKEIISTVLANESLNRCGLTFVHEACEKTGMSAGDVVQAYVVVRDAFELNTLWREVEALDNRVAAATQCEMLVELGRLVSAAVVWLLRDRRTRGESPDYRIEPLLEALRGPLSELSASLRTVLGAEALPRLDGLCSKYVTAGVPAALAERVACVPFLVSAFDLVSLCRDHSILTVAKVYFQVGEVLGFDWLRQVARRLPASRAWDRQAIAVVVDDLYAGQRRVSQSILLTAFDSKEPRAAVRAFQVRRPQHARVDALLGELRLSAQPDFSMLAVAARQLSSLAAG